MNLIDEEYTRHPFYGCRKNDRVFAKTRIFGKSHRAGSFDGHALRYGIDRLVYFEIAETMAAAIAREKQLKRYRREWKRNLIERKNPAWNDLAAGFGLEPLVSSPNRAVDPGTRPG